MHRMVSGRSLRGGKKESMLVGLVPGVDVRTGEGVKVKVKCEEEKNG